VGGLKLNDQQERSTDRLGIPFEVQTPRMSPAALSVFEYVSRPIGYYAPTRRGGDVESALGSLRTASKGSTADKQTWPDGSAGGFFRRWNSGLANSAGHPNGGPCL
jgi:hypothetical protein